VNKDRVVSFVVFIAMWMRIGLLKYDIVWLDECSLKFWQKIISLSAGIRQFKKN